MSPVPFCIVVWDGVSIRTIHPPALGEHRAPVEAVLASVLDVRSREEAVSRQVDAKPGRATTDMLIQAEISRASGFTGDACPECGNFAMKRNGSCLSCAACGATTGCS
jgi:ribonucleoside-diphosphate reductase alpha chain